MNGRGPGARVAVVGAFVLFFLTPVRRLFCAPGVPIETIVVAWAIVVLAAAWLYRRP